jgi:hypothetical protein
VCVSGSLGGGRILARGLTGELGGFKGEAFDDIGIGNPKGERGIT